MYTYSFFYCFTSLSIILSKFRKNNIFNNYPNLGTSTLWPLGSLRFCCNEYKFSSQIIIMELGPTYKWMSIEYIADGGMNCSHNQGWYESYKFITTLQVHILDIGLLSYSKNIVLCNLKSFFQLDHKLVLSSILHMPLHSVTLGNQPFVTILMYF